MFTDKDLEQIASRGSSVEQVGRQIESFRTGFPFLPLAGAALVGDGIMRLTDEEVKDFCAIWDEERGHLRVVKFVPASGAATRMFKELFEFLSDGKVSRTVDETLAGLDKFAFAGALEETLGGDRDPKKVIGAIIKTPGLNYGAMPKALIRFHHYDDGARTAAEEHLAEGAMYCANGSGVNLHFTVSGEHLPLFKALFDKVLPKYEEKYGVKYEISFSQQKSSTDTIAVNEDNTPFREADGRLLFRPAGHGALIENLSDIDADIIFIKNIDNVAPDRLKEDTVTWKKALAGVLLYLQEQAFVLLDRMDEGANVLAEAMEFVEKSLCYRLPEGFASRQEKDRLDYLRAVLDRPMRVCGVVRNEGEPGGGPFRVSNPDGSAQLQIAESSQIDPADLGMMRGATHFNPVDVVCGVRDHNWDRFDLTKYTDPETGFISEKSKDGRKLRAQELPGLWNGAMARWNTVFVEVPISTFSPVKVVTDLLRPQHQ